MSQDKNIDNFAIAFKPEFGASLIETAKEDLRKKLADQCVVEVQTVLNLIEITTNRVIHYQAQLVLYKARLKAIELGQVSLSTVNGKVTITYLDRSLRPEANDGL